MTTGKVVLICGTMMLIEFLYIKQNAATLLAQSVTGSANNALASAGANALVDVASVVQGLFA